MMAENDLLRQGLEKLGFAAPELENLAKRLEAYCHELELFNSAYDLVGADTHDDVVVRHILDSVSAVFELRKRLEPVFASGAVPLVADIGTGGGLPGIPLALAMPDVNFMLVERMSRRCLFLENCKAVLGLENVQIQCEQAERVALASFDAAVFRAFRPLDKKMAKVLLRVVKPGGFLAAYKARLDKITEEMEAIKEQVPEYQVVPLNVPFLTDDGAYSRNLVVISK